MDPWPLPMLLAMHPPPPDTAETVERARRACRRSLRLRLEAMLLLYRLDIEKLDRQMEDHLREVRRTERRALSEA